MSETSAILKAAKAAQTAGKRVALATVVQVEGSSYRRPGARMLITEDGQLTGAISGGCLEGDALRKALLALHENRNKLVTYDSLDDADAEMGMQLGCNGKVDILFEPVDWSDVQNPLSLLAAAEKESKDAVLVTFWNAAGKNHLGTVFLQNAAGKSLFSPEKVPAKTAESLAEEATVILQKKTSEMKDFGKGMQVLFHFINPPVRLLIVGAGNDVQPVATMAAHLGWDVTVADGRASHSTTARFPAAEKVIISRAENLAESAGIDSKAVCLLMTHNYQYDLVALQNLLAVAPVYIGILGPKKRWEKLEAELAGKNFLITEAQRTTIYAPLGLDLGAETAVEIALAVLAEIQSVLTGTFAQPLRAKNSPIHARD